MKTYLMFIWLIILWVLFFIIFGIASLVVIAWDGNTDNIVKEYMVTDMPFYVYTPKSRGVNNGKVKG